jgi:hypothetical protein
MNTVIANRPLLVLAARTLAVLALAGLATAAQANSFTNGNFSGFTNAANGFCSSSAQVVNSGSTSNLTGWSTGAGSVPNTSYTFDMTLSDYSLASGGFTPIYADNSSCTNIGLQVPQTTPTFPANQPSISPLPNSATNFIGTDPKYEAGAYTLAQAITGLTNGATYIVTFYAAAGQQQGFVGNSTDSWTVGLGASAGAAGTTADQTTATINLPDSCDPLGGPSFPTGCGGGFSGWVAESMQFVAGVTNVLWFLGNSTAATSQPPFVLLDGVTLSQTTTVPEPPAYGMLLVGLLGVLGVRRAWRLRR